MPVPGSASRVLVVEPDDELRDLLSVILSEEDYAVESVTSLKDALPRLAEQVFGLILADLYIGRSPHSFTEAHVLRRRAHPIPIGLLTTQKFDAEEVVRQGFAFLIREPFEITELLSIVAATMRRPLSAEQERQAKVAQGFFVAIQNLDWRALETLCAEDIIYYPLAPAHPARKIQGFSAYRSFTESQRLAYAAYAIEELLIFPTPRGLVAIYRSSWLGPDSKIQRQTGATFLHFRGERIAQIGLRMNIVRLKDMPSAAAE